jgi:imidazolonepropionase-like amidohydrolase
MVKKHATRRISLALCATLGCSLAIIDVTGQTPQATVAIVGATVIDGNGGPPMRDATLVVAGKRITALGPRTSVTVPSGAQVIDGNGKFVTPGFIDSNVHLSHYGAASPERYETLVRYQHRQPEVILEAAQLHLRRGVTTVRDSYGQLVPLMQVRDAVAGGESIGPRMLVAGNIVGWGGPFSISFGLIRDTGLTLFQEQMNDALAQGAGEELMEMAPEELRVAINKYLDKGPNFIKYGGTSHFSSPTFIGFSPDAQKVIVEEAHKRGLVAETHSTTIEGLRMSVLAGVDLVQHPESLAGREYPDSLVQLLRDRKVICSLHTKGTTGESWQRALERVASAKKDAAKTELARPKTLAEQRRDRSTLGLDGETRRFNEQKLIKGGCVVSVGTDNYWDASPEFRRTPMPPNQEHGLGTIIAIEGLVELGMTPSQAIVSATKHGAMAAKGLQDFGTLEVGKFADLVLLDADPLASISNIRKVRTVMKEGRVIDPGSLPTNPIFTPRPTTSNQ